MVAYFFPYFVLPKLGGKTNKAFHGTLRKDSLAEITAKERELKRSRSGELDRRSLAVLPPIPVRHQT